MKICYTSSTTTMKSSQPLARSLHPSVFVHGASTTPHILTFTRLQQVHRWRMGRAGAWEEGGKKYFQISKTHKKETEVYKRKIPARGLLRLE